VMGKGRTDRNAVGLADDLDTSATHRQDVGLLWHRERFVRLDVSAHRSTLPVPHRIASDHKVVDVARLVRRCRARGHERCLAVLQALKLADHKWSVLIVGVIGRATTTSHRPRAYRTALRSGSSARICSSRRFRW
jgi:hypothetical protein